MRAILNIENDEELRLYIKDCIRGQVLAIAREEYTEIVKSEFDRKMKERGNNFDYLMKQALKDTIQDILYSKYNVTAWSDQFIKPFIDERLNEILIKKNWEKLIDDGAQRLLTKLIQSQK